MGRFFCSLLALAALLCLSMTLIHAALPEGLSENSLAGGKGVLTEGRPLLTEKGPSPVEIPPAEEPPPPVEESASSIAEGSFSEEALPPPPAGESAPAAQTPPPVTEEHPREETPPPLEESPPPVVAPPIPELEPPPPELFPPWDAEWALRLVNWENPLPVDFEPEYEVVQNRFVMDKRVAPVARQMIADALTQGITLVVNSAYRPYSSQQIVYNTRFQKYLDEGRSEEEARWLTNSYVAIPGYSEHQLGLALDIVAVADREGADGWLAAHAPDYGFILRYPADKTALTHTAYESWHYRYVGVPAAREITSQGLCLEEYLALYYP